jgi:porin
LAAALAVVVVACAGGTGRAQGPAAGEEARGEPTTRPAVPEAQPPAAPTAATGDVGRPFWERQRATDDWFGARPRLEERGIGVNATLAVEAARSLVGGPDTRTTQTDHILDVNLTLDMGKLFRVEGGTFFVNFQNQSGGEVSSAGSLTDPSDVTTPDRTEVSELWYEQTLWDGKLRVKVGKVDAVTEFTHIKTSEEFRNDSFEHDPTIIGLPTHPDPAVSINVFAYPTEHLYAGFGLYDGSTAAGRPTGPRGLTLFDRAPQLFLIGEVGGTWDLGGGRDGKLGLGVWHLTKRVPRFDGRFESAVAGGYLFVEQTFWRPSAEAGDERGIGVFAQYGVTDPAVSVAAQHVGGGVAWKGPIAGREDDAAGVGLTWIELARDAALPHGQEWVGETFYRVQVTKFLSVKPDLQYLHDPAFNARRDAVVALVQVIVDF